MAAMSDEFNNKRCLHKNKIYFPKENHSIVSLLQYGRREHTLQQQQQQVCALYYTTNYQLGQGGGGGGGLVQNVKQQLFLSCFRFSLATPIKTLLFLMSSTHQSWRLTFAFNLLLGITIYQ